MYAYVHVVAAVYLLPLYARIWVPYSDHAMHTYACSYIEDDRRKKTATQQFQHSWLALLGIYNEYIHTYTLACTCDAEHESESPFYNIYIRIRTTLYVRLVSS